MASSRLAKREALEGFVFISPWIFGFVLFLAGPLVASLALSFTYWDLFSPPVFIGWENYSEMIADRLFWQAMKVTLFYTLTAVPLGIIVGFSIALLMNQKIMGVSLWRTIYYLPAVVSGVAVSLLWIWVFNPEFGVLNSVLALIGIEGPAWLASRTWALPALVLMSLWGAGGGMVIYLAGLQGIPTQLYEAAEIDGANVWFRFWQITLPMMTPVILFQLIMGIIGSFQVFTQAYVMTAGGPANATLFYVLYLYRNAFEWFKMGYASSLAWVLFLIIMVCSLLTLRTSEKWVYYEGEGT